VDRRMAGSPGLIPLGNRTRAARARGERPNRSATPSSSIKNRLTNTQLGEEYVHNFTCSGLV